MIKIVDYGMGNLRSVQKAFEKIDVEAEICTTAASLDNADKLVLPGVGAFQDAMTVLRQQDMIVPIQQHIESGRPFLGICLGLQLLFDVSYEDGEFEGLGIVPGSVVRFEDQPDLKIPHMGWNQVSHCGDLKLLEGIPESAFFYFVHSYYVVPTDDALTTGRTDHGTEFVSTIQRDNLYATQFHPEKSQRYGLQLLRNFANL
ncbi:MAG: imidazole glycerol phosphate synthase subunit HisH [Planctomycetaceae bacterium]|nr:imidazole glycerol phosphate synthase subunit HisH [Planctomycetaceae bacterium]